MNLIKEWILSIEERILPTYQPFKNSLKVSKLINLHSGPKSQYANITLLFEPAICFNFETNAHTSNEYFTEYLNAAIFDVFDILYFYSVAPSFNIKITVLDVQISDINSSENAFREAGRQCCLEYLTKTGLLQNKDHVKSW